MPADPELQAWQLRSVHREHTTSEDLVAAVEANPVEHVAVVAQV